jgi:hypothetical protein
MCVRSRSAWKPRPPWRSSGFSRLPSAPNSVTAIALSGEDAAQRARAPRGSGGERVALDERVVVPAEVVRPAEHVDVRVHRAGLPRRVRAPDVERDEAARVAPLELARDRRRCRAPARRVALAGHLVGEVPGQQRRVGLQLLERRAHALARLAHELGPARRPRAGRVDRPDAHPHQDACGVEALHQRRAQRVLRARGVGLQTAQVAHERIHVLGAQGVAAPGDVLVQRRAAQHERPAVEADLRPVAGDLAQADAPAPRRPSPARSSRSYSRGEPGAHRRPSARARSRAPRGTARAGRGRPGSRPRRADHPGSGRPRSDPHPRPERQTRHLRPRSGAPARSARPPPSPPGADGCGRSAR